MMEKHFWAKTTEDGKPGISVVEHLLNVGNVAFQMAELSENFLHRVNLSAKVMGALAALHDIGKISPGFQIKCEAWLKENNLSRTAANGRWDSLMESNHGKVSQHSIQAFLSESHVSRTTAAYLSAVIGGHHGRLTLPNLRWPNPQLMNMITDPSSGIDWENERKSAIETIWKNFGTGSQLSEITETSPALWWLAGLTSVADWIGSDERFFPVSKTEKPTNTTRNASVALEAIGFNRLELVQNLSFHDLFFEKEKPDVVWLPNEMQMKALSAINGRGVYVIEAPMGTGKTEAALWASYQLLCEKKATGIYFALPTQATSNRIHIRMNEFIERIAPDSGKSRLIHANSWLKDQRECLSPARTGGLNSQEDARKGRDWFSSAKRALLAPFGVGTVDQALLGVVAAKHFFVRHYGLAGKVVVIDEVHSYDLYTGTLIDKLITTLEGLGCTVIILSATLTGKRRGQIVAPSKDLPKDGTKQPYPLITGRKDGTDLNPVPVTPQESRDVQVLFNQPEKAVQEAINIAQEDGCVLWICNTVDEAQKQFRKLDKINEKRFQLGLLHSRFPFWRREELENEWMERLGKDGKDRRGSILVSTQVVEQSVDLDADLLITELAPTDMLLQRLGRLWRHKRQRPRGLHPRLIIISEEKSLEDFRTMKPQEILECLGPKSHVYEPIVLLRSLQEWKKYDNGNIKVPNEIRPILEATYDELTENPKSWEKLFDDRFIRNSNERFKATLSSNYWQPQLPDEEGVQTRLNEMPTLTMVLCRGIAGNAITFLNYMQAEIHVDTFKLATAQAIHENAVKVPTYCFEVVENAKLFSEYVRGLQCSALVLDSGSVSVNGLKDGVSLFYSNELGLVINKPTSRED
jgi:CRISPR-associated endonuclease/helicase Cas3